ncbi:MAG: iron-containing alcohol dehydrogenase [Atribacterota bacterium]
MPLIIHSKSTKEFAKQIAKEYNNTKLIDINTIKKPKPQNDEIVVGIGGGKVIDYAKVIAGENRAIAIPTTAAGAAATSHAVYWDPISKRKIDIPTKLPKLRIEPEFLNNLPIEIMKSTTYDALAHALDSYWSKKATKESKNLSKKAHSILIKQIENDHNDMVKMIQAGNIAGKAIEITGTNMTHALSYPLTALYDIPHGIALGWVIPPCASYQQCDLRIPLLDVELSRIKKDKAFIERVATEAMTYKKIHDANKDITKQQLIELLGRIICQKKYM